MCKPRAWLMSWQSEKSEAKEARLKALTGKGENEEEAKIEINKYDE